MIERIEKLVADGLVVSMQASVLGGMIVSISDQSLGSRRVSFEHGEGSLERAVFAAEEYLARGRS